jgi:tetratricopeptide (TPR) repeat protein
METEEKSILPRGGRLVSTVSASKNMQSKPKTSEFVRTKLPWVASGIMLVLYLVTINQWVSARSLQVISKVAGWDWTPPLQFPLFYTLTYPFRFLPQNIQPISLNIFSAVCAAGAIWMLVRSVGLLPHDRTDEQRIRQRGHESGLLTTNFAWAPALLAAAVLGLELTMWEHATAATNESLDLLIFAYLLRCILEYRVSKNEKWMTKLAFVYGLGVTNNWALIGYFPLFLAAVVWVKKKSFLEAKFIIRMAALGLTGMLLYVVLPLVWTMKGVDDTSFFEGLRLMLAAQKTIIFNTPALRARALILSLTSILPVVIMFIKFPSGFGDVHSAGAAITNTMFRTIHLFFAGACIWIAFDQQFSPRTLGHGLPFLTFYYLSALAVGYYVAYLMLVHTDPPKRSYRQVSPLDKLLNPIVQAAAWGAVAIVPIALLYKNFRVTLLENGKVLQKYAEAVASQLPSKPAILLSEDSFQLSLMEAWLSRSSGGNPHILVNTRALPLPTYHRNLIRRYGSRWPEGGAKEDVKARIEANTIATAIARLALSNSVFYLHPSFGYPFELVYTVPHGMVMEVKRYPTNVIYPPRLSASQVSSNQLFWESARRLVDEAELRSPFKIPDAEFIGTHVSRALNQWGVDLQRTGDFTNSIPVFEMAVRANSNNIAAQINLSFNEQHRSGKPPTADEMKTMEEIAGQIRSYDSLVSANGPLDSPQFLYTEGTALMQQSMVRQAADRFRRASELAPTNYTPRLALANALIRAQWIPEALELIGTLQKDPKMPAPNKMDLISMEAAVEFARKDTNRAEAILIQALQKYPDEGMFYNSLNELYHSSGQFPKAIALMGQLVSRYPTNISLRLQRIETALNTGDTNTAASDLQALEQLAPDNVDAAMYRIYLAIQQKDFKKAMADVEAVLRDNEKHPQALVYKGFIHMENKEDDKAIEAFSAAIKIDPGNLTAIRNRAIAELRAGHLNDAKKDYETMMASMPRSHTIYYGLGEIAYKKNDKQEALRNYELYLRYAPRSGTTELEEERKKVEALVKELQASK